MLGRVLWRNIRIGQMIGAGLGAIFGMLLLLSTFQLFLDFRQVLTSDDGLLSSRYMVVNKTLSTGKTVGGILGHVLSDQDSIIGRLGRRMSKEPVFSEQEIDDLLALDYVEDAAAFSRSRFEVSSPRNRRQGDALSTNLFFDAVPDRFLDLQDERWIWRGRGQDVPIVIPKSYLNLYNFGFAPSYALPQLSAESFDLVTFRLDVSEPGRGRRRSERFIGRIVGFTDRLNSPLVPESFLEFATPSRRGRRGRRDRRRLARDPGGAQFGRGRSVGLPAEARLRDQQGKAAREPPGDDPAVHRPGSWAASPPW